MTKIAAISAATVTRQPAAKTVAPVVAKVVAEVVKAVESPKIVAQIQPIASAVLGALIEVQAKRHTDPQPDHGKDDQHGHEPPVLAPPVVAPPVAHPPAPQPPHVDPQPDHGKDDQHGQEPPVAAPPVVAPPVVAPPVVQPPVVQPPVSVPPVVAPPVVAPPVAAPPVSDPPVVRPHVSGDLSAPVAAQLMLDRQFADVALSTLARNADLTATAASRTAAYVGHAGAALSILSALETNMQAFNAGWSARQLRA